MDIKVNTENVEKNIAFVCLDKVKLIWQEKEDSSENAAKIMRSKSMLLDPPVGLAENPSRKTNKINLFSKFDKIDMALKHSSPKQEN